MKASTDLRHVRRLESVNGLYGKQSYHSEAEDATSRNSSYIYLRTTGVRSRPLIRTPLAPYSINPSKAAFLGRAAGLPAACKMLECLGMHVLD